MPEENPNTQNQATSFNFQRRTKILLALLALFSFATIQLYILGQTPSVVDAGATLTPTVPMPADTEVPPNTPVPPTETPVPTSTDFPPTSTPIPPPATATNPPPPTATNPPTTSGGSNNTPPSPTPTELPVQEIPELGVSNSMNIVLTFVVAFFLVMVWTGYTVVQATSPSKE